MKKLLWMLLAIIVSPLAVALLEGFTFHFWLNLILWLVSFSVLGIIHAWYLILTKDYPQTS